MRHRLILSALAAALMAPPALAHQRDPSKSHCPELARESRMEALERRIESLQTRLDRLDGQLSAFEVERRQALDEVKVSIEMAAHDGSLSQPEVDAAVAAALARADERAKAAAASAAPAQQEARSVEGQIGVLVQRLHALARQS